MGSGNRHMMGSYETFLSSGRLLDEQDLVAELLQTADVVAAEPGRVATVEVVGPEVLMGHTMLEHVPESHEHRVLHGDNRLLGATPRLETVVLRAVVTLLRLDRRPGDLLQRRP